MRNHEEQRVWMRRSVKWKKEGDNWTELQCQGEKWDGKINDGSLPVPQSDRRVSVPTTKNPLPVPNFRSFLRSVVALASESIWNPSMEELIAWEEYGKMKWSTATHSKFKEVSTICAVCFFVLRSLFAGGAVPFWAGT